MKTIYMLFVIMFSLSWSASYAIPPNAQAVGNGWACSTGFKRQGQQCNKIYIPPNAKLLGEGWSCIEGFKRVAQQCNRGRAEISYSELANEPQTTKPEGERHALNLKHCLSSNSSTKCDYNLLSPEELTRTKQAERSTNLKACLSGNENSVCQYGLLSSNELIQAKLVRINGASAVNHQRDECYESSVIGTNAFMGNNGEIFKLEDGKLWEIKFGNENLYQYSPEVIICPSQEKLVVNGKSFSVKYVGG